MNKVLTRLSPCQPDTKLSKAEDDSRTRTSANGGKDEESIVEEVEEEEEEEETVVRASEAKSTMLRTS